MSSVITCHLSTPKCNPRFGPHRLRTWRRVLLFAPAASLPSRTNRPSSSSPSPTATEAARPDCPDDSTATGSSRRVGSAPLSSLLPSGSDLALRNLLQDRHVAILWDLDNVDFFAPSYSAALQVWRLRALVADAGGKLVACRTYGNMDTLGRLSGVLPLLEGCGLVRVEPVAVRRDAADLRLVHDALAFAATRGSGAAAVLCVSQDTDFAGPLRYLSERAVRTLAVSPHAPRRKTHAAMEPATYFRRLPLPNACWAALKWEAASSPVTAEEATWLRNVLAAGSRAAGGPGLAVRPGGLDFQMGAHPTSESMDRAAPLSEGLGALEVVGRTSAEAVPVEAAGDAAAIVELQAAAVAGASVSGEERSAGTSLVKPAGSRTSSGSCAVPRAVTSGLELYTREGACCPGTTTRLWLNPEFCRY